MCYKRRSEDFVDKSHPSTMPIIQQLSMKFIASIHHFCVIKMPAGSKRQERWPHTRKQREETSKKKEM